jgi:16S rRNA (adenine1518-N6/adenine1519-N6)-dimethyltransferase
VFAVIDAAFAQRRKTLRAALAGWAGSPAAAEEALVKAGIAPSARGEQLAVHDFARIAEAGARSAEAGARSAETGARSAGARSGADRPVNRRH